MTPWKLPLIVGALVVPIVVGFLTIGPALGMALGALAVLVLVVVAVRQRPYEPIGSPPGAVAGRHVLIVTAASVESPTDVARIARVAGIGGAGGGEDEEVRVLAPARIGFLDRWATDVEGARQQAQQRLVATVAALAKAGVAAEARVGDEDLVQAVEDQLQSYPATEVVLVSDEGVRADDAVVELRSRLATDFHHVRLGV